MYRITCLVEWDMAHRIPLHQGKCRNLHGHRYRAEVTFSARVLTCEGFVLDFSWVKLKVKTWIDTHWDHNTVYQVGDEYMERLSEAHTEARKLVGEAGHIVDWYAMRDPPTAEHLARHLFERIREVMVDEHVQIESVRLYETPTASAEWVG